jgi:hypothetical protein
MLHTRPEVKAGPIDRSLNPAKVGADIGSGGRLGASFFGSSLGFTPGSCAVFSTGSCASLFAELAGWRLGEPQSWAGIKTAVRWMMRRVRMILTSRFSSEEGSGQ